MNKSKRRIAFKKTKDYVENRKHKLRFDVNPFLHRSTNLREDINELEQINYQAASRAVSDVWCERYDQANAVKVISSQPDEFWSFVNSGGWADCSSLRICEGALLDRLQQELFVLADSSRFQTYEVQRFDYVQKCIPNSCLKSKTPKVAKKSKIQVKITFTYYALSPAELQRALVHDGLISSDHEILLSAYTIQNQLSAPQTSIQSAISLESDESSSENTDEGHVQENEFLNVRKCGSSNNSLQPVQGSAVSVAVANKKETKPPGSGDFRESDQASSDTGKLFDISSGDKDKSFDIPTIIISNDDDDKVEQDSDASTKLSDQDDPQTGEVLESHLEHLKAKALNPILSLLGDEVLNKSVDSIESKFACFSIEREATRRKRSSKLLSQMENGSQLTGKESQPIIEDIKIVHDHYAELDAIATSDDEEDDTKTDSVKRLKPKTVQCILKQRLKNKHEKMIASDTQKVDNDMTEATKIEPEPSHIEEKEPKPHIDTTPSQRETSARGRERKRTKRFNVKLLNKTWSIDRLRKMKLSNMMDAKHTQATEDAPVKRCKNYIFAGIVQRWLERKYIAVARKKRKERSNTITELPEVVLKKPNPLLHARECNYSLFHAPNPFDFRRSVIDAASDFVIRKEQVTFLKRRDCETVTTVTINRKHLSNPLSCE